MPSSFLDNLVEEFDSLPMTLPEYLLLAEWTGRQLHAGKRGYIKNAIPPLLDRLGTSPEIWLLLVEQFEPRQNIPSADSLQLSLNAIQSVSAV